MKKSLLRPPGAKSEEKFLALCIQCGQCIAVCPYRSLRLHEGFSRSRHTPKIIPEAIPCYLCMKCPSVCPTGALDKSCKETFQANMGQAYIIKEKCHNFNGGIMCSTCYDRCPLRGDGIVLDMGFIPSPTDACVGCGVCSYVCPVKAIEIVPFPNYSKEKTEGENKVNPPKAPHGALEIFLVGKSKKGEGSK